MVARTRATTSRGRPHRVAPTWRILVVFKKHLFILFTYTLVALALSHPLALDFASALPGVEGDAASYLWALGWARRALELGADLFHSDYVFYPLGGATQLLWAVSLIGFISIPLQYAFGLVAAHNALWLAATVLTGYGTFLLADDVIRNSKFEILSSKPAPRSTLHASRHPSLATRHPSPATRHSSPATPHASLAAFTAGLVFAFAPLRLGYGLAFFNLFNTQFIPFYILFLLRAARGSDVSWRAVFAKPSPSGNRLNVLLAGLCLGLNAYVDFQIAAFLALFSALYALYEFVAIAMLGRARSAVETAPTKTQTPGMRLARVFTAIALVALIVAAPMLWIVANDFAIEGGNYIRVHKLEYSAARAYDAASFFVPHARSALYVGAPLKIAGVNAGAAVEDADPLSPDRQAFIGYVALALASVGAVKQRRAARLWVFIAAMFALFSLGPTLHVLGQDTRIPLPYVLLNQIPILNHIRIPMRYGVMVLLAVAVVTALGIGNLESQVQSPKSKVKSILLFSLLPFAVLLEYVILPYPLQPFSVPRVYADMAREPGDFAILEIPSFNWRHAAEVEVYQAIHGKRILRAYSNRIAPDLAEYFGLRGTPIVVRSLRILEGAEKGVLTSEEIAEDRRVRDEVLAFYDLRYAVLHKHLLKPDELRALDVYLRDVLDARVTYDDAALTTYQLPLRQATTDTPLKIDLRENSGQMYAGRGWQFEYPPANWNGEFNLVWARGSKSEIYFRAEGAPARALTLRAYAAVPQRVAVWLNGVRVDEVALASEWRDYRVVLPVRRMSGMNRVELQYGADLRETIGVTTIEVK